MGPTISISKRQKSGPHGLVTALAAQVYPLGSRVTVWGDRVDICIHGSVMQSVRVQGTIQIEVVGREVEVDLVASDPGKPESILDRRFKLKGTVDVILNESRIKNLNGEITVETGSPWIEPRPNKSGGYDRKGFKFIGMIQGGEGEDVWDKEIDFTAADFVDAAIQLNGKAEELGGQPIGLEQAV